MATTAPAPISEMMRSTLLAIKGGSVTPAEHDGRTIRSLRNRKLITGVKTVKLTKAGEKALA